MPQNINILLVSSDQRFRAELESAVLAIDDVHAVIHHANDVRQAIEAARSRRPQLALVEMGGDVRPLQSFAEEAAVVSPETTVAAVFRPESFGTDVSESTVLIEAIRAGVKDFLRRPVSTHEISELLRRLKRSELRETGKVGRVVSFVSNKGGVGKSTMSVNVACGLAVRHPGRVLLVDASLQMGVCASLLDLTPTTSLSDLARESERLDITLIRQLALPHKSGLHLLAAPAGAMEAADVDDEILSRIITLARRTYDFVVVDTFPMLDRAMIAVLDLSDRTYIVLENVVPTILGGVKFVETLGGLGVARERQRVVLNRNTSLPGSVTRADVRSRLGRDVDHVVPFDTRVVVAANTGEPYILHASRFFGSGRSLRRLIAEVDAMGDSAALPVMPEANGAEANGEQSEENAPETAETKATR